MKLLLLALLGCGGKLPGALAPDAPTEVAPTPVEVSDLPSAARALVGTDPLLRRPRVTAAWDRLPGGEPVADWAALATRPGLVASDWYALERRWPGTLAVPLARGARLATLESLVAGELREEQAVQVAALLAPLSDLDRAGPADIRPPLDWLEQRAGGVGRAEAVLRVAERAVLLGWLDAPGLPVQAAAEALQPGIHDRLLDSPAGALLVARARSARDAAAGAEGRADLARATHLALAMAAADRDAEQAALKRTLDEQAAALRAEGAELPDRRDAALLHLLRRGRLRLAADAGEDTSAGLALVALAGERWLDACPDQPCAGLDRTGSLARATAWGDAVAPAAAAWRVIATKQAVDTAEVTLDRPTWGTGAADLVDLLLGAGAQSVDLSLLRQGSPGPATWLAITRAAGAPDATDPEAGLAALRSLLVQACDDALALPLDAQDHALVQRIRDRAAAP